MSKIPLGGFAYGKLTHMAQISNPKTNTKIGGDAYGFPYAITYVAAALLHQGEFSSTGQAKCAQGKHLVMNPWSVERTKNNGN
jgi:hypothetical protein